MAISWQWTSGGRVLPILLLSAIRAVGQAASRKKAMTLGKTSLEMLASAS
jgi:hypothetical protein